MLIHRSHSFVRTHTLFHTKKAKSGILYLIKTAYLLTIPLERLIPISFYRGIAFPALPPPQGVSSDFESSHLTLTEIMLLLHIGIILISQIRISNSSVKNSEGYKNVQKILSIAKSQTTAGTL